MFNTVFVFSAIFYLIAEVGIKGLLCKKGVLTILAKFLKKSVKEFFRNWAKILINLFDIEGTLI